MTTPLFVGLAVATQAAAVLDTLVVRLPPEAEGAVPASVTEELRLGTLDGADEQAFGFVSGVVVDARGVTWVGDAQATTVRRFGPDGAYLGGVGGKGGGPGEFEQVQGLALLPDGGVAVWDPGSFRVSVFDVEGAYARSFPVSMTVIMGGPDAGIVADTAGNVLIRTSAVMPRPARGPGLQEAVHAWLRFGPDGEPVDSLIPPRRDVGGVVGAFKIETASRPSPLGYFVTGRNDAYAIVRPLPDGRAIRLERRVEPVPFAREERAQWEAFLEVWESRWGRASEPLPRSKPVWRSLFVDVEGRIWLSRYAAATRHPGYRDAVLERGGWPAVEWRQDALYDVLDPRGTLVTTVELPAGARVVWARDDLLWAIETGSFDEQYVVRYRVSPAPGAGP